MKLAKIKENRKLIKIRGKIKMTKSDGKENRQR
jgi:hypothetical protein